MTQNHVPTAPNLAFPIARFELKPAPPKVQKWIDKWNDKAQKSGSGMKLYCNVSVGRTGVQTPMLILRAPGIPPRSYSLKLAELADDLLAPTALSKCAHALLEGDPNVRNPSTGTQLHIMPPLTVNFQF